MAGDKIRIKLRAFDHKLLDQSAAQIVTTVRRTGSKLSGPVPLPTEKSIYCVIRSPFVDKDIKVTGFIYDVKTGRLQKV